MYRFITLIWNSSDPAANAAADFLKGHFLEKEPHFQTAYAGPGLEILQVGEEKNRMQAYPLDTGEVGQGGAVLGKLYKAEANREKVPQNAVVGRAEAHQIIESKGRDLTKNYWGSYVAFFQARCGKYILVDPMGGLNCFQACYRDVSIYFSHMPDLVSCEFMNCSVDWAGMAQRMSYGQGRTDIPVQGLTKILPGQCLSLTTTGQRKDFYWDPQTISLQNPLIDLDEAVFNLQQVIHTTVAAMAAPYSHVMQSLGGLDSSLLLASLKEAPSSPQVSCVTQYTDTLEGDERFYARQTTDFLKTLLKEYKTPPVTLNFTQIAETAVTSAPPSYLTFMEDRKKLYDIFTGTSAEVMFNGFGGDEILYVNGQHFPPLDFMKQRGLRFALLGVLMETARLQRRSIWSLTADMIRGLRNKSPAVPPSTSWLSSFLTPEILDIMVQPEEEHPWIRHNTRVPPGKLDHLAPLATGRFDRESFMGPEHSFRTLHPFLAQPVVEMCLRIPTWLLLAGGKGRGLARKAFKNSLPPQVVWRSSKSAIYAPGDRVIHENIEAVKALILEGELNKGHFLKRKFLEDLLKNPDRMTQGENGLLFHFLDMEIWARKIRGENFSDFIHSRVA